MILKFFFEIVVLFIPKEFPIPVTLKTQNEYHII